MTTHLAPATRPGRAPTTAPRAAMAQPPLVGRVLAEFAGTGLLVLLGVSAMVVVNRVVAAPSAALPGGRYVLGVALGLAFGYTVALLISSPLGRVSGHFNPAISLVHWISGRLSAGTFAAYVVAQLAGGLLGASLLPAWGALGAGSRHGATTPDPDTPLWIPAAAETASTMLVALAVIAIAGGRVTGRWTFHLIPLLYGAFGPLVAPLSGLSTNPARTLGPAIATGTYDHLWLYFVAPPLGAVLAVLVALLVRGARRATLGRAHHPRHP